MRGVRFGLVAVFLGLIPQDVVAQSQRANLTAPTSGHTYFNRPGATTQVHDSDVQDCMNLAERTWRMPLGPRADHFANVTRARVLGTIENCMVIKGWRVVALPRREGVALARLPVAELSSQLQPWIGADTPHGRIARTFSNEAARADTVTNSVAKGDSIQLGVIVSGRVAEAFAPTSMSGGGGVTSWPGLSSADIAFLPPDNAIGIVRLTGLGRNNGAIHLQRVLENDNLPEPIPSRTDPADAVYAALNSDASRGPSGEREITLAFPLRPGRWVVRSRLPNPGILMTDFCLGAPGFDVQPGETVLLGTFDTTGTVLGPTVDLEIGRQFLSRYPDRLARLRGAEWQNGITTSCRHAYYTYALEVPGAPFVVGYEDGSRAWQ